MTLYTSKKAIHCNELLHPLIILVNGTIKKELSSTLDCKNLFISVKDERFNFSELYYTWLGITFLR